MAGTTISSLTTVGIGLRSTSQSPVTLGSAGTINVRGTNADAIYGACGVPGTLVNAGFIEAPNGNGMFLRTRQTSRWSG